MTNPNSFRTAMALLTSLTLISCAKVTTHSPASPSDGETWFGSSPLTGGSVGTPYFAVFRPEILAPQRNEKIVDTHGKFLWRVSRNTQVASHHRIWFAQIVGTEAGRINPAPGTYIHDEIVVTPNALRDYVRPFRVAGLQNNLTYRFAVGACPTPDCREGVVWTMRDYKVELIKPAPPTFFEPDLRTFAPRIYFYYTSADEAAFRRTTHFEEWAAVYRGGKLLRVLTSVERKKEDIWGTPRVNDGANYLSIFAFAVNQQESGDVISFQVRACADNVVDPTSPRACSAWAEQKVTVD